MSEHEVAPLSGAEAQALRTIAQELTRTDPRLLDESGASTPPVRSRAVRVGGYLLVSCLLIGVATLAGGVLPAPAWRCSSPASPSSSREGGPCRIPDHPTSPKRPGAWSTLYPLGV